VEEIWAAHDKRRSLHRVVQERKNPEIKRREWKEPRQYQTVTRFSGKWGGWVLQGKELQDKEKESSQGLGWWD